MIFSRRRFLCWLLASASAVFAVYHISATVRVQNYPQMGARRKGAGGSRDHLVDSRDVAKMIRSDRKQTEYIDKKGVHVVVGRYVGSSLDSVTPNFTRAELDTASFADPTADPEAGAGGAPVVLTGRHQVRSKRLWHLNKFNIVASDMIPENRTLKDVRKPVCASKEYPPASALPSASVIIVFHNEAWSTLTRTVRSVVDRSPADLLEEFILVDDDSDRKYLGERLERYLSALPVPAKVIRAETRVGLIQARLKGAAEARGSALVFLDAHCEVSPGWLEPLLHRISESRSTVVCPVIDIISDDTFAYTKSFSLHWGAFNWEMHFRWFTMSRGILEEYKKDQTKPYRTPAMAGGLFAVDRDYFYEVGAYDGKMDIWGGENLEMSFRVWQCGGSVEIAPCSHVGHVFRRASPYTFPREGGVGSVLHSNLARVARVWMDDLQQFYFRVNPQAAQAAQGQDVQDRSRLRAELKCRDFQWYLDHVWPEHFFPSGQRRMGSLRLLDTDMCLQKPHRARDAGSNQPSGDAVLTECAPGESFFTPQLLVETETGGYLMSDESVCLDAPGAPVEEDATVRFQACSEDARQRWVLGGGQMGGAAAAMVVHSETGRCLTRPSEGTSDQLTLSECRDDPGQRWSFEVKEWRQQP